MAVKARKGNTMNEEFITLLKRVKAIQETPASELTEQDKAMIEGRIIVQENYEKNLMRKNNLETIMEELRLFKKIMIFYCLCKRCKIYKIVIFSIHFLFFFRTRC